MKSFAIIIGLGCAVALLGQTAHAADASVQSSCQDNYRNPRVKTKVNPKYTPRAHNAGVEGTVKVRLEIDERGLPDKVTLYEGIDEELNQRAIEAARQWRFFPATCGSKPVRVWGEIEIKFALAGSSSPVTAPSSVLPDVSFQSQPGQSNPRPVDTRPSADPWQYPIRLGDTRVQVHTLLSAATRSDSILEEYPASGVSLWFDSRDRVTKLNFIGPASGPYWGAVEEMPSDRLLLFGLTARSDEHAFRQALGDPRELPRSGVCGRSDRHLIWKKSGYVVDGLFFLEVHDPSLSWKDCLPQKAYRPGTLVWFEVYRGL
jgi:TonB family protein